MKLMVGFTRYQAIYHAIENAWMPAQFDGWRTEGGEKVQYVRGEDCFDAIRLRNLKFDEVIRGPLQLHKDVEMMIGRPKLNQNKRK